MNCSLPLPAPAKMFAGKIFYDRHGSEFVMPPYPTHEQSRAQTDNFAAAMVQSGGLSPVERWSYRVEPSHANQVEAVLKLDKESKAKIYTEADWLKRVFSGNEKKLKIPEPDMALVEELARIIDEPEPETHRYTHPDGCNCPHCESF